MSGISLPKRAARSDRYIIADSREICVECRFALQRAIAQLILSPVIGPAFGTALAGAQAGDEEAFACLFRGVQPALLGYLRVIAADAAEDVASETWLQVVAGLGGFRGGESAFRAWVFTIARHRAVDAGRARARRRTIPLDQDELQRGPIAPDAGEAALEAISTQAVVALLATLPRDQADIILLRVVAGLSNREVGRLVGKSPGAVRVAAHRGLRRLAILVDREGVTA
jgi:RNA polymerase sigma-70 factor (ECF subfamily)